MITIAVIMRFHIAVYYLHIVSLDCRNEVYMEYEHNHNKYVNCCSLKPGEI